MIVYDNHFNTNEWCILAGLFIGVMLILFLPKRFSLKKGILYFTCGVFTGFFFDHTLSVQPVSYYDVNDNSSYQLIDFISYLTFGNISYFFFYIYDRYRWKPVLIYILICSFIFIGLEWGASNVGVYHYRHGYKIFYSFPIYFIVGSCWIAFYYRYKEIK